MSPRTLPQQSSEKRSGSLLPIRDEFPGPWSFLRPFYMGLHGPGRKLQVDTSTPAPHFHDGLELGYVVRGTGTLMYGDRSFALNPEDFVFIDTLVPHGTYGQDMEEMIAHLRTRWVINAHIEEGDQRLWQPFVAVRSGSPPVLHHRPDLGALLQNALDSFNSSDPYARLVAWAKILPVLTEISRTTSAQLRRERDSIWLKNHDYAAKAMEMIRSNFQSALSLRALAAQIGVSTWHMSHIFKEHAGMSVLQYRDHLRIARAMDLLVNSRYKISAIAQDCGYADMPSFYRTFRKLTGANPSAFQAKQEA